MTRQSGSAPGSRQVRDPGANLGLVFGGVWVLFLIFPVRTAVTGDLPIWQRVVSVALTVAFTALYLVTLSRGTRSSDMRGRADRWTILGFGLLVVTWVAQIPLLGLSVLSFSPFVLSLTMFVLGIIESWIVAAVVNGAITAAVVQWRQDDWWSVLIIAFVVTVVSGMSRIIVMRSIEYEGLREEMTLGTERERVARDVHDVLGHTLTVISVKTELAERLLDSDPERARAEIREIHDLSRKAISEVRQTVGACGSGNWVPNWTLPASPWPTPGSPRTCPRTPAWSTSGTGWCARGSCARP